MARASLVACVLVAVAGCARPCLARAPEKAAKEAASDFGVGRPFVLSLEHLAGVSYQRISFDQGGSRTSIQAGSFAPFVSPATPEARLGVHYFVVPGVSLGAVLDYVDNDAYGTSYLLGARVGYALPLSRRFAVWARCGVAYTHTKQTLSLTSATVSNVLPGGDVLLVFLPHEDFAILAGPMLEVGLSGEQTTDTTLPTTGATQRERLDFSYFEAALTIGVLADF